MRERDDENRDGVWRLLDAFMDRVAGAQRISNELSPSGSSSRDVDVSRPRPDAARSPEADDALNVVGVALEHGLDGAVGAVGDPARTLRGSGALADRVAEEHALDAPVNGHSTAYPIVGHGNDSCSRAQVPPACGRIVPSERRAMLGGP